MTKPPSTDVIDFLSQVVQAHVRSYRSDFEYDVAILTGSATKQNEQDRTFYWMGRECGTWCFKERDIFLQGTPANLAWLHYADSTDIKAYRVTLTGLEGGKVMGSICPIRYAAQVQRVKASALPVRKVKLTFQDGETTILPYQGWEEHKQALEKIYGRYDIQDMPDSEAELAELLRLEHQTQNREAKHRPPPKKARRDPAR